MKINTIAGISIAVLLAGGGLAYVMWPRPPAAPSAAVPQASAEAAMVEVRLPATLSAQAATGQAYYQAVCASCHGVNGAGQAGIGPPLVDTAYAPGHHGDEAFVLAARNGVPAHDWNFGPMLPIAERLTASEIGAIIVYIRSLQRENGIL